MAPVGGARNGETMLHLLPVQVQSLSIAIDARQVQEIVGEQAAVFLPGARPEVPGIIAWRGRAVGLFDLAAISDGLTPLTQSDRRSRVLVIQIGASTLAVPVDAVREVREMPDDSVQAPRLTAHRYSTAEVEIDGAVIPVFDFAAFLASIVPDGPGGQSADASGEHAESSTS